MILEGFPVTNLARCDDEPEILAVGESTLEKPVDPSPASPICRRWPVEVRRKSFQFKRKLAEDRGCDG